MAGIDALAQRYPVDTTRMGIMGFSYGGKLTSYAITRTKRFRAAVIIEGITDGELGELRWVASSSKIRYGAGLGMVGPMEDPWNPQDMAVMRANDPVWASDRVSTPNLIETGSPDQSSFALFTEYWYASMLFHHVPVEWWVYPQSGHGWSQPRLVLDSFERTLRWFDYWLRGARYVDPAKQARYDAWMRRQAALGDPRWLWSASSQ
jgi:dipeptidyl aminopeptidase/acylaminoacyl peptidase